MKVSSVRFVKSVQKKADFPRDQLHEIAFIGRSNVGKSSLLNTLTGTRGLARISRTPGRTQTINFYAVNERMYFVDLPGYGYAKAPLAVRGGWRRLIEGYLTERIQLRLVLLLVDCRIPPTPDDVLMKQWLDHYAYDNVVILTKTDKLSRNQLSQSASRTRTDLAADELIPFSAVSGLGKDAILARIRQAVS